jgi:DNA-binding response OmpR family regulator
LANRSSLSQSSVATYASTKDIIRISFRSLEAFHAQVPPFPIQEVTSLTSPSHVSARTNVPNRGRNKASTHRDTLVEVTTINTHYIQRCDAACFLLVDGQQVLLFAPTAYRMLTILLEHLGEMVPFEELAEGSFDLHRDRGLFSKHITTLRQALQPLGLTIRCVNRYGYLLQSVTT